MEMNTTPLIDVLLVLLIMFIITLPPPTHAVKVDLPMDCKTQPGGCPDKPPVEPDKNVLYILPGGQIMWNTTQVGLAELQELLIPVDRNDAGTRTSLHARCRSAV